MHGQSTYVPRTCQQCGKEFQARRFHVENLGGGKFCSRDCRAKASHRQVEMECRQCKKTFSVNAYRVQNGRAKFCSRECQADWESENGRVPLADRFWSKIEKQESGCWFWTGHVTFQGYGAMIDSTKRRKLKRGDSSWLAHRLSWFLHHGPIPEGIMVLHNCDKNYPVGDITYRKCVNPAHLFLGDNADNSADMASKGRNRNLPHMKLDPDKVRDIRSRYAAGLSSQPKLAKEYGVSLMTIHSVIERWTWKHVK